VSNEEVLSLVNEQRCLVHVIKQRQANWIGHVLRHDCLLSAEVKYKYKFVKPNTFWSISVMFPR